LHKSVGDQSGYCFMDGRQYNDLPTEEQDALWALLGEGALKRQDYILEGAYSMSDCWAFSLTDLGRRWLASAYGEPHK
jgi:hypothetical protein